MASIPDTLQAPQGVGRVAVGEYIPEDRFGLTGPGDYQAALEAATAYQEGLFDAVPRAMDAYVEQLMNSVD